MLGLRSEFLNLSALQVGDDHLPTERDAAIAGFLAVARPVVDRCLLKITQALKLIRADQCVVARVLQSDYLLVAVSAESAVHVPASTRQ